MVLITMVSCQIVPLEGSSWSGSPPVRVGISLERPFFIFKDFSSVMV